MAKKIEITSTLHASNSCALKRKCHYCGFAVKTSPVGYYRLSEKTPEEMEGILKTIEESGIRRVSISAGYGNFEKVYTAARLTKEKTSLEVLVNVGGDLERWQIKELASLGVETVCCNLETVNERLFYRLKPDDNLQKRLKVCEWVKEEGIKLSSGPLVGLGESDEDRKRHIKILKSLEVDEVPVMGFRPYPGTPMENHPPAPVELIVETFKEVVEKIPSAERRTVPFPIVGFEGLRACLEAGANNVATVVPKNYPMEIKGVGTPRVGILEELLPLLQSWGYTTNVRVGETQKV
jgi:biotin synthase